MTRRYQHVWNVVESAFQNTDLFRIQNGIVFTDPSIIESQRAAIVKIVRDIDYYLHIGLAYRYRLYSYIADRIVSRPEPFTALYTNVYLSEITDVILELFAKDGISQLSSYPLRPVAFEAFMNTHPYLYSIESFGDTYVLTGPEQHAEAFLCLLRQLNVNITSLSPITINLRASVRNGCLRFPKLPPNFCNLPTQSCCNQQLLQSFTNNNGIYTFGSPVTATYQNGVLTIIDSVQFLRALASRYTCLATLPGMKLRNIDTIGIADPAYMMMVFCEMVGGDPYYTDYCANQILPDYILQYFTVNDGIATISTLRDHYGFALTQEDTVTFILSLISGLCPQANTYCLDDAIVQLYAAIPVADLYSTLTGIFSGPCFVCQDCLIAALQTVPGIYLDTKGGIQVKSDEPISWNSIVSQVATNIPDACNPHKANVVAVLSNLGDQDDVISKCFTVYMYSVCQGLRGGPNDGPAVFTCDDGGGPKGGGK